MLSQSPGANRSSQKPMKTDLVHFLLFCNPLKVVFKQSWKESVDTHTHRHHHSVSWCPYSENSHQQAPRSGAQILSWNSRRKTTRGPLWSCWQNEVFIQDASVRIVYFTAKEILWRKDAPSGARTYFICKQKINLFTLAGGKSNSRSSSWRNSDRVCRNTGVPRSPREVGRTFSPERTLNILSPCHRDVLCGPR